MATESPSRSCSERSPRRPLISAVLDQLLRYIKGHPGVWIPRHDELADWVNAQGLDEVAYAQRFAL